MPTGGYKELSQKPPGSGSVNLTAPAQKMNGAVYNEFGLNDVKSAEDEGDEYGMGVDRGHGGTCVCVCLCIYLHNIFVFSAVGILCIRCTRGIFF